MLQQAGVRAPTIVHLVLSRETAAQRLVHRRVCGSCGEPMYPLPPVDGAPSGLLTHLVEGDCESPAPRRLAYDDESAATHRLDAFDEHTAPLLEQLRAGSAAAVHDVAVGERSQDTWAGVLAACGLPPEEEEEEGA